MEIFLGKVDPEKRRSPIGFGRERGVSLELEIVRPLGWKPPKEPSNEGSAEDKD